MVAAFRQNRPLSVHIPPTAFGQTRNYNLPTDTRENHLNQIASLCSTIRNELKIAP